jgi:small GTP-binding protein
MPVISLVGRPNVGKSTLFNRLSRSRQALVSDFEGLTRDRQYGEILFDDDSETYVTLIDTGGLTNQDNIIDNGIQLQVLNALEESKIRLTKVDLPTFGLPKTATAIPSTSSSCASSSSFGSNTKV